MSALTVERDWARKRAALEYLSSTERALWTQIADEIDAYLDRPTAAVDLFGEVTDEPVSEEPA